SLFLMRRRPGPPRFPYTTLFRSGAASRSPERFGQQCVDEGFGVEHAQVLGALADAGKADRDAELARQRKHHAALGGAVELGDHRSEEHTSELQSRENLVCRLLLE